MQITNNSVAGSLESSDCLVSVEPRSSGISIDIKSSVMMQFGTQIKKVIEETLQELGVTNVSLSINDKGALDCTIKARTTTAIKRAAS